VRDRNLFPQLEHYIQLRRTLGYLDRVRERWLEDFVHFVAAQGREDGPIRAQMAVEWACAPSSGRGLSGQIRRLQTVRGFLLYLRATLPDTEVPGPGLLATLRRPTPYLYSPEEIQQLMRAASLLKPIGSFRAQSYTTMIGLMASTGLRISEAIRLTVANVRMDAETPYIEVLQTKFRKSRLVPLHLITVDKLRDYGEARSRRHFHSLSDAFFISSKGSYLNYYTVWRTFATLKRRAGIRSCETGRRPCIHGLRHTFAVSRLLEWYRAGLNVNDLLPTLSTYMGHSNPVDTYWYLSATPELLSIAGEHFQRFADQGGEQ
jgi:integrase/recombinase XerD